MAFCLVLSGCQKLGKNNNVSVNPNISGNVKIESNGQKYECKITHTSALVDTITFVSPKNIEGLTFNLKDGQYELSFKNLSGSFGSNPFGDCNFVGIVIEVLNSISNPDNLKFVNEAEGDMVYEGSVNDVGFKIITDKEGNINLIEIPSKSIVLNMI